VFCSINNVLPGATIFYIDLLAATNGAYYLDYVTGMEFVSTKETAWNDFPVYLDCEAALELQFVQQVLNCNDLLKTASFAINGDVHGRRNRHRLGTGG
jgi:hypothetical protein